MGSDVKQSLAAAEKLLKAGKLSEAIAKFDRVVDESNGDLLTVNRVGDAIVSAGKPERAVPYYARIADQFSRQGFYPKAIAIRKKILRLTPESAEALVGLADLYVRQEHPAEARTYYTRAAEHLLNEQDFVGAKEVYERMVEAEPDDPRHRVRLAETRAAAGDETEAAEDLVQLGQRLLQSGKPEDAEKSFRRAGELAPDRADVVTGLVACLTETGRDDEALALLEGEVAKPDAAIGFVAELVILYEINGRVDDANRILEGERAHELPEETFRTLVRFHDRENGLDELWARLEPVLGGWTAEPLRDKLLALLVAWPGWTAKPHVVVLEWRLALADEDADEAAQVQTLESLIEAYQSNDMEAEGDKARERLHALRPPVEEVIEPVATEEEDVVADQARPDQEVEAAAAPSTAPGVAVPVEYEAPAVPLSRADEEFVSGRMTKAEILEKYGLLTQAMDQVYEVIERFPGHLEANQHLVTLLRGTSQESALSQALVKLALARRAAGRLEVGRQALAEADKLGGIDPHVREILVSLDLFPGEATAAAEAQPVAAAEAPRAAKPRPESSKPMEKPGAPTPPVGTGEAVIDFDSFDDDEEDPVAEDAAEEVTEQPVAEEPVAPAPPVEAPLQVAARGTESAMRFEPLPAVDDGQDDDDLRAIAAALEDDLFEDDPMGDAPASESEESLDEVFAAFRERVEEEVDAEDFRTHYDLGIGYKEMGLIDAAIAEFEISVRGDMLFHESCVMLALCCREQDQPEVAADWYRRALDGLEDGNSTSFDLRYDLAEVLAETGDTNSALDVFRDLQQLDPGFRDVAERVSQLSAAVSD